MVPPPICAQAGDRIRAYSPESKKNFMENLEMWMTEPKTTDEVRNFGTAAPDGQPSEFMYSLREPC